jgi:2-methylisocitrate lyase-like PEP mutase family enzyme
MATVRAAVPPEVPLVANMVEGGKTPRRTVAECAAAGFRIVVLPIAGLLAATHALGALYAALARDGSSRDLGDRMLDFDAMNTLLGVGR